MIRAIALASVLSLALPGVAAAQSSAAQQAPQAEADGAGQLPEFWQGVFPLPGESYGMFPDPYGNPHGDIRTALAEDGDAVAQDAGADEAGGTAIEQQAAVAEDIPPTLEGPDLRDATGGQVD